MRLTGWTFSRVHRPLAAALLAVLVAISAGTLVGDIDRTAARGEEGFQLFSAPSVFLASNRLQCRITNDGDICGYTAPSIQGAYFPTGTPDDYFYNSGLQMAAITDEAAGPWAGDTAAAYVVDLTSGPFGKHATELSPIYDSLDPEDLANWPDGAYVKDPEVFAPILIGRKTASSHDTWVQYWDADPARNSQREHPMGIKVTQRSMSWNFPSGNESVIYFVFEFENVTDDAEFQRLNELHFFGGDDRLPDEGWAYRDVYVAITVDTDVGPAGQNFTSGILPFDMSIAYHGGFRASDFWEFPPEVFFPPFFIAAPGIAAVKYLKSPTDPQTGDEIGLSMMSMTTNPGFSNNNFPDPQGAQQLWRYLSGHFDLGAGDPPCNVAAEVQTLNPATTQRSVCFVPNTATDVRFFQASGPFSLGPGESSTVVGAWMVAPTVETMPDGSPSGIVANTSNENANAPGIPSFHPGFESARGCDVNGADCTEIVPANENEVNSILKGAGWVAYNGPPPAGTIYPPAVEHPSNSLEQYGVEAVPGSLLDRALVAQTVFNNKFLLGFPPERPAFYLVPGDNNVTVIWEPSPTETEGDPFYEIARDPESTLFNPNYREFDVEGYRIWRGTQRGALKLIAQFDYEDTRFVDFTCETVPPDEDLGYTDAEGNPLLGFAYGDECPGDYATNTPHAVRKIDGDLIFNNGSTAGPPGAGVSRAPRVFVSLDTAVVSDRDVGEVRPLSDSGVPFYYVDQGVTNNFTYFYAVTAFDVNSMASTPHSLRSVQVSQSTVPRQDAPNLVGAELQMTLTGDDGVPLNPGAPMPKLDPEDGTWSGPMPPTDRIELSFAPLLPRLLPQLQLQVKIDSVTTVFDPGSDEDTPTADCPLGGSSFAVCEKVWMSYTDLDGNPQVIVGEANVSWWGAFGTPATEFANWVAVTVPFDQEALDQFGIPEGSGLATADVEMVEAMNYSSAEGSQNRRSGGSSMVSRLRHGGSRWFDGENETTPDPTRYMRVGHLEGVDTIFAPMGYTPFNPTTPSGGGQIDFEKICHERANALYGRHADVQVTWGEGGTVTVRDVTHNVDVPNTGFPDAGYGFIQDANGNGVIDWQDFNGMPRVLDQINDESIFGGGDCNGFDGGDIQFNIPAAQPLQPSATLSTVHVADFEYGWADPANGAATWTGTGQGFGLYINGQRFIFQMAALPAPGTVWTLRSYSGGISSNSATFDSEDPSGYAYNPTATNNSEGRPVLIPGLVFNWLVEEATNFGGPTDLTQVHTVPDPYLATSRYDATQTTKQLMFVNLPPQATIRIYTLTGVLVDIVNHDDPTGGGRAVWNLRNRNNQFIASGVYFFHVVTPDGDDYVGKFTVITAVQ